jgi:hypothetical protein
MRHMLQLPECLIGIEEEPTALQALLPRQLAYTDGRRRLRETHSRVPHNLAAVRSTHHAQRVQSK